ncbi:gcn5-related n-acetyltransferase [Grosmannia clavigera kw1407]|uniref:Gcn5-related n-acetyltransferase n=1 Tax=Grosmannia clavigera (strain kw1407 / UAMH 11150) TaxID=655863 RepID=F0XBW6_GROCL|nr:gcn5-related n-acetyltransferase [Grosmannia clavigera kw1407]EFX04688.1 gcn5-related n-acetyltransferase [Grosmannia clavigera kw1407]
MAIEISRLTEADIPGAVAAIQRSFIDDPYEEWMYYQSTFSPQRSCASLTARCQLGIHNELFYVAKEAGSDKVLGVAMWLRPRPEGQKLSWVQWANSWRFWFSQLAVNIWHGRGGLNVKRYYIFKAAQAQAIEAIWIEPRGYYFLNTIAIVPEAQGKGIGRKLVSVVTDRADAEQMPCYLESSKAQPNMAIYERWGFQFVRELTCDDDGAVCKLYCMVRKARQKEEELRGERKAD